MEVLLYAPKSEMLNPSLPDCFSAALEKAAHFSFFSKQVCSESRISWPVVEKGRLNSSLLSSHSCLGVQPLWSILCSRKSWGLNIFSCFTVSYVLLLCRYIPETHISLSLTSISRVFKELFRTVSFYCSTVQWWRTLSTRKLWSYSMRC